MLAAVTINFLEKIAPKAVATLGKAGVAEVAVAAGFVAEGLNLLVTPIVEKGTKFAKAKIGEAAAKKQQEMLEKRAAKMEQLAQEAKAKAVVVQAEEVKEEKVEEKPTTSKKKGK